MRRIKLILAIAALAWSWNLEAQILKKSVEKKLLEHVQFLSDDKLEGRMTGSLGERLAFGYISKKFKSVGLKTAGEEDYLQPFSFTECIEPTEETYLKINGELWEASTDFYPLNGSGNGVVHSDIYFAGFGIHAPDLGYNSYEGRGDRKGMVFIIELGSPDGSHPHSKYADYLSLDYKIKEAIEQGAAAIVFINPLSVEEDPTSELDEKVKPYSIPIIFAKRNLDYLDVDEIVVQVEIARHSSIGHNVLGYINNHAEYTVVIGAHYDHLGYGGEGSLYRGAPAVHNGADDNASGIALMIELASALRKSKLKNNNYLFIAFSGEELGLYGSSYFTKSDLMDRYKVNYMLNMDMVGRLDTADNTLIVNGVGTSPNFSVVESFTVDDMRIKTTKGGVGPSDHTSFYFKDIPVLHFFSGTHNDYHKPSDDWDKINVPGMRSIGNYMLQLIKQLDSQGKLTFSKTKQEETNKVSKFKVTLGIVPDYAWEDYGLRVDGVTDGKPASKGGILAGDIIIQMGDEEIKDIYAYMGALGKFNKGETIVVRVKRGEEELDLTITF